MSSGEERLWKGTREKERSRASRRAGTQIYFFADIDDHQIDAWNSKDRPGVRIKIAAQGQAKDGAGKLTGTGSRDVEDAVVLNEL